MQALKFLIVFALAATAWANSGSITVYNSGHHNIKFTVSYDLYGERKSEQTSKFDFDVSKRIEISDGATDISVEVAYYLSLVPIYHLRKHYNEPDHICFKASGTLTTFTLNDHLCGTQ